MMDIVEELRAEASEESANPGARELMERAAVEIEKYRGAFIEFALGNSRNPNASIFVDPASAFAKILGHTALTSSSAKITVNGQNV